MRKTHLLAVIVAIAASAGAKDDVGDKSGDRSLTAEQAIALGAAGSFGASDPLDGKIPGVDLSGLDATARRRAHQLLRKLDCTCGCGMKLLTCRLTDPTCPKSPGLAQAVIDAIGAGKSDDQILPKLEPVEVRLLSDERYEFTRLGSPVAGAPRPKVTIVEFADFQCGKCAIAQSWLKHLLGQFPGQLEVMFKHFPEKSHHHAQHAAEVAAVAHAQGKFWPLHDKMFIHLRQLDRTHVDSWAAELGVDLAPLSKAGPMANYRKLIERDRKEGLAAGVHSAPAFFVNGRRLVRKPGYQALEEAIGLELANTAETSGE